MKNDKQRKTAQRLDCKFCVPDAERNYEMIKFINPENPNEIALMSFYGGEVHCLIEREGQKVSLRTPASNCPKCGRAFEGVSRDDR